MTLPLDADLRRPEPTSGKSALVGLDRLSLGRGRPLAPLPRLVDKQARRVEYLRLSVTDRCNFRCLYCMPEEGLQFSPRAEVLSYEEIIRLVRVFVSLGITRVRLTGGEPLLRRDIVDLVRAIAALPGVEDLALSTNGHALAQLAGPLAAAGLRRVNVSIDSLRPERFAAITRTGELQRVLDGIEAARAAGMTPVKLNVVVLRGDNDDELADLVRFGAERGHLVRFIEYMPIGVDGFWSDASFVPVDEMLARLARDFDVSGELTAPGRDPGVTGGGPARYTWLTPRGAGASGGGAPVRVGFITALSDNFCAACNRVRLTATGRLQECLAFAGSLSLRDAARAGATDAELADLIAGALGTKGPGHRFDHGQRTPQSMSITGG